MKRRRYRPLDVAPYQCGCIRFVDMPAEVCRLCLQLVCPIHASYLGHDCPQCPRCGIRHGRPLHSVPGPVAANPGKRWLR